MSGHRRTLRTRLMSCVHTGTSKLRVNAFGFYTHGCRRNVISPLCCASGCARNGEFIQDCRACVAILRKPLWSCGRIGFNGSESFVSLLWALTCPPHPWRFWLICAFVCSSCRKLSSNGPVGLYELGPPIAGFTEDGCLSCCSCDVPTAWDH